ncbi:RNA-guided endonuclease InsQ/TnpB family protein [Microseira sp. BLCC-F43]|jgi:putative transposase|uniref:RNA-guided endonuclease InsQ/TnpB family protein n=1 Tax=Microseira sp. BLCC-F43 TaxID=3153602 RepID=UPI0035B8C2D9
MLLCKKIRLVISKADQKALEFMQAKCRGLYNWWIGKLRQGEQWKLYEAKKSLQESKQYDPQLHQVYGKLLAEVYFRIDSSMQAFYRRVKSGETPGFPRFRPRHAFFTLCYPASYLKVEHNRIILPTGGKGKNKLFANIQAVLTEQPPEKFKEVAVSRDSRGNYYCSIVYEAIPHQLELLGTVAFDLGVKTLAVGVNSMGRNYHIGGFKGNPWFNKQLDRIRAKRDKCKKGSRRYRYLSHVYHRVSEKRRNKQKDSLHKASSLIAYKLAESAVVIGDLSVRQMAMKSENKWLNRAVFNDWGLYQFVLLLKYKCQLALKQVHLVSERDTSKTCHRCGHIQDIPLAQRTYHCPNCSLVMDSR